MSARHARPTPWRGAPRVLAFGVASLAIAAVGTTQGTGAFYYDAVHLSGSITAAGPTFPIPGACLSNDLFKSNSGGNDVILVVGTDGADTIVLGSGRPANDDEVLGSSGLAVPSKHVAEGGWAALYTYDPVNEKVLTGPFQDMPKGNNHAFIVLGLGGDDVIMGGQHDDCIAGGAGDDLLYGGDGHDVLVGGAGKDLLYDGNAPDVLVKDADDTVVDGNGPDRSSTTNSTSLVQQPPSDVLPPSGTVTGDTTSDTTTTEGTTTTGDSTTTGDTTPPVQPDQDAGPSQEGTTG